MNIPAPRRLLVFYALAFGTGIFVGYRLENTLLWLLAGLAAFGVGAVLRRSGWSAWLAGAAGMFFLGAALCSYAAHPDLPPEGKYRVQATVHEEATVREEDGRVKATLKNAVLTDECGIKYRVKGLYWTYWPETPDEALPKEGQTAEFTGRIYHPEGKTNPHGFDFKLYLLQNGMQAGISGAETLILSPEGQTGPRSLILRVRQAIFQRLEELLHEDMHLASALLLGETEGMSEEMRAGFRKAGVAHVLSVSGLHAMIIMSLVIALMDRFSPSPRVMLLAVGVVLIPYCALTGGSAPIIRAAVLVMYQLFGRCVRRRPDPLTGLAVGFLTVLIIQPLQLFSSGFQMSFAAVAGMIMLGDRLKCLTECISNRIVRRLCTAYAVTFSATAGTALPVIYCFSSLSLIGFVINPLVCLATEMLLPLFFVMLLVSVFSMPLAAVMGQGLAFLSRLCTNNVQMLGELSFAGVVLPDPPWYLAAAIVVCLLLCTRYVDVSLRNRVIAGVAALSLSIAAMIATANHDVRYIQMDVGNASAAVIEDGGKTIVIDAGEYGGDLSNYLLSEGRSIDALILTHLHTDHALGLKQLLEDEVKIERLYLSTEAMVPQISDAVLSFVAQAQERGIPVHCLRAGDEITTDRVHIEVLWPREGTAHAIADANDSAMALEVNLNGTKLLHMSDIPLAYELYAARPAEILCAGHHGSASSTGEVFLKHVQPANVLISGDDPSEKTLKRLANAGAMVYDTGTYGALIISAGEETYSVQGYLQ